jgi:NAD(P)-dependent dehydrogenase (short-subunit alcohol dehydrogenase family)
MTQSIVVLGARNLGGAIIDHFVALGWNAAAVARSEGTINAVRARGALAERAQRVFSEVFLGETEGPFLGADLRT